jgi:hypothetical protein
MATTTGNGAGFDGHEPSEDARLVAAVRSAVRPPQLVDLRGRLQAALELERHARDAAPDAEVFDAEEIDLPPGVMAAVRAVCAPASPTAQEPLDDVGAQNAENAESSEPVALAWRDASDIANGSRHPQDEVAPASARLSVVQSVTLQQFCRPPQPVELGPVVLAALAAERQARRRRKVIAWVALAHAAALAVFAGIIALQPRQAVAPMTPMFSVVPSPTAATYSADQVTSAAVELRSARALVRQSVADLLVRPGEVGVRDRSLGVAALLGPRASSGDHEAALTLARSLADDQLPEQSAFVGLRAWALGLAAQRSPSLQAAAQAAFAQLAAPIYADQWTLALLPLLQPAGLDDIDVSVSASFATAMRRVTVSGAAPARVVDWLRGAPALPVAAEAAWDEQFFAAISRGGGAVSPDVLVGFDAVAQAAIRVAAADVVV